MHHSMFRGWLGLALGLLGLNCGAAGETTDDPVAVTEESLGSEDPAPAPGGLPGGGHDPGGPGSGWAGGWANDPQYAPYAAPSGTDPNQGAAEAQRQAHDRENAPYRSHGGEYGGPLGRPYACSSSPEPIPAPPAPRWTWGPLNDKARCNERCFEKYMDDAAYCKRLPDRQRGECQRKAVDDYQLCVRECSRRYPRPKDD
jgi:hypothetical protein